MKIKVSREDMQKVLQNIQGIVEKKSTMPILSHFLLKAAKTTTIIATDLDIAFTRPLKAEVDKKGSLCIPARKLFEIAREVDDDIVLESQENNWLKVTSGKSTFKLMGLPEDEYPALPKISSSDELNMGADTLRNMIEKTVYATGDSDTRYTLNGLLFHFVPKKKNIELRVVGTDGHRLAFIADDIAGKISEEKKLILPKKAAIEIRRLLEDSEGDVTIGLDKNHIFFSIDDIVFTSRLIEGTYPNYEQVIPQDNEKKAEIDRIACAKALRRTSIMSRERTNAVRFDLEPGKLTLISINPDVGEAREEIAAQYKGEPISIGYNARYLLDVVQTMTGDTVAFELQDPLSPTLIREGDGKSYKCVIMPMRI
ncbi:MAG TPA: DNA polymerase III subunit beta [Nitrospirae bacterium]|nr:DNA polymerase III subunit beta [bacterium BMS3Abin10]GBE37683.1 DNA polymerase III subunit beta [bacterium BMS3Bbin08]HDH50452.1 DNA polymerase III subunit beta [Nitrospirota bacterium]HDK16597.1 DNA polymerase III subunit beta [Nitrospirota bacterium]HDK82059.1 DNA polymerase III subunit beta [Nitrospirota bacterium]